MRALYIGLLFALIVGLLANFHEANISQHGHAQQLSFTYALVVRKNLEGTAPESDWGFIGSDPIGAFTIDKGGGEKTFTITTEQYGETYTITEMTKSSYIAYGRAEIEEHLDDVEFTKTHVVEIKLATPYVTHIAEFRNLAPPVGGYYKHVDRLAIVAPYLAIATIALAFVLIRKRF